MPDIPKEAYKTLYMIYLFPYYVFCLLYLLFLNFNSFFKKSKEDLQLDMKLILIKTLSKRNEISIGFWIMVLLIALG
jgi:hypothetical protein